MMHDKGFFSIFVEKYGLEASLSEVFGRLQPVQGRDFEFHCWRSGTRFCIVFSVLYHRR